MIMSTTNTQLSKHARDKIDALAKKFPADRKKSALLGALNAVQHENNGFLTEALMDAVADYMGLAKIEVYDPWVDPEAAKQLEQPMTQKPQTGHYDLVVLAVAHDQFLNSDPRKYLNKGGVLFDLKGLLPEKWVDERL